MAASYFRRGHAIVLAAVAFPATWSGCHLGTASRVVDLAREATPWLSNELYPYLELVETAPRLFDRFDPVRMMKVVNGLWSLGGTDALEVLRAYSAIRHRDWSYESWKEETRVRLICRLLFVPKRGAPPFPWFAFGMPSIDVAGVEAEWPLFPLTLEDELPLMVNRGAIFSGPTPADAAADLEYCRSQCDLRERPLRPQGYPPLIVAEFLWSPRWQRLAATVAPPDRLYHEDDLRAQGEMAAGTRIP